MEMKLMEVRGLVDACLSLKMSKRNYTEEYENKIRFSLSRFANPDNGFVKMFGDVLQFDNTDFMELRDAYRWLIGELDKLAKWGAGVGVSASIDAGHETILRFIDFSVHVTGLHRGAQDDLDSHAMRMNNRIVRSSSRLTTKGSTELSDWYKNKVIPFGQLIGETWWMNDEAKAAVERALPETISDPNGVEYTKTVSGYVATDLLEDKDVLRGLYPLGMASDCIFKISLHDMRHVYKRRNKYTHAAPELQDGIEMLADQIEKALPGDLGKLIRNDYCSDGELHHIMTIEKQFVSKPEPEDD